VPKQAAAGSSGGMFDLPPVSKKRGGGGFELDEDMLKEQQKNIAKINALKEFDEIEEQMNKKGP
jgi:hypothetical protein